MSVAYINIGSNIGDRHAFIEQAVTSIEAYCNAKASRAEIMESPSWGYRSTNPYLNLGIAIETTDTPVKLHEALQRIQREICDEPHRDHDGNYADRAIDIDLIALGSEMCHSDSLTLPHPKMHLRKFVLQPMVELAPGWRHPVLSLTCGEMLELLPESEP